jgi:hypothetical protein
MLKNYVTYIAVILLFFGSMSVVAQDKNRDSVQKTEQLNFYPNPVSNGKIYLTSNTTSTKEVEIFDVLGKSVFKVSTASKEINISSLSTGVYIIKIKEGEVSATRKLIVK